MVYYFPDNEVRAISYEVIQKVGRYQYIYLAEGFRDERGQVRQKRRSIGKVDPTTGEKVYKPEYLEELRKLGKPMPIPSPRTVFSMEDIQNSSVRSYGQFLLFRSLSERLGLGAALRQSLPQCWQEVFMLACCLIASGDALTRCADWLQETESYPVGAMTSLGVSQVLSAITQQQRKDFYQHWHDANEEAEYRALNITLSSSPAELCPDVEWAYPGDEEKRPPMRLCLLMGEAGHLPVAQFLYSGSQNDVRLLRSSLSEFAALTGNRAIPVVLDKGFYSRQNIDDLLQDSGNGPVKFLLPVPLSAAFAKEQVAREGREIDSLENTMVINGQSLRAVTRERSWDTQHTLYTHIYYNAKRAMDIREDLYARVALLREKAREDPEKWLHDEECQKYLLIRKSDKENKGYTINIRSDVVEQSLESTGWVFLISNDIPDAKKAMSSYSDKNVLEQSFLSIRNSPDWGRLPVHSDDGAQGKLLVGFIAAILMASIHKVMKEKQLYQKFTMTGLLRILARLWVQEINDHRIIAAQTKEQRMIFEAFDITLSE